MESLGTGNKLSRSPLFRFLLLELVCISLLVADFNTNFIKPVRTALSVLSIPLIKTIEWPQLIWKTTEIAISRQAKLINENTSLKQQLVEARLKSRQNTSLLAENERLRHMLNATELSPLKTSVAFVSNINMENNKQQVLINKGSKHGVFEGQAVLSLDGIVGQVYATEYSTSHVLLITDQSHAIPIEILRTSLRSLAYGTNELNHLSLPEIPVSADVRPGDIVVTSGFGNLYPRGLKLAEIQSVSSSLNLSFKIAVATPFADLSKLTEVFLISPQTEQSLNNGNQEK